MTNHRRKLLVDSRVQGALLFRVVKYWIFCLMAILLMVACWSAMTGNATSSTELLHQLWSQYAPALGASLLLLPLVMLDCLRVSNRFAGPIFRLHSAMKRFADGEEVRPVEFRVGDFWHDFAEDFNRVINRPRDFTEEASGVERSPHRVGQL